MIGEYSKHNALPFTAASDVTPYRTVAIDSGAVKRQAVPLATNNVEPQGIVGPATGLRGESVTVYGEGAIVEALCLASIGAGQDVNVGSSNGALGLIAAASGVTRYRVGKTIEPAAAGEKFSVYVSPKQISNLI